MHVRFCEGCREQSLHLLKKQHLAYVAEYDIGRLKKLLNEGKIISYLEEFEDKCFEVVDNQVEKWKAEDKEYQLAIMNGGKRKIQRVYSSFL